MIFPARAFSAGNFIVLLRHGLFTGRSVLDEILKYWEIITGVLLALLYLIRHIFALQRKVDASITEDQVRKIIKDEIGELKGDISGLTSTIHSAVREFDQKAFQLAMQLSQDKRGNE